MAIPARIESARIWSLGTISISAVLFVNPKSSCVSNRRILDSIFSAQYHDFPVDIFFDLWKKLLHFRFL
jgi:hypothetical protein